MTSGIDTVENKASSLASRCFETPYPKQKRKGAHPVRSLVVDDDNTILNYVAQMLTNIGLQTVKTAQKIPEVMNELATGSYDLLVTDLEMPDINGYQLAHEIKKEAHDIKVIIMTGRPEEACLDMMATQRADGWLFKPFGLNELRSKLKGLGLV